VLRQVYLLVDGERSTSDIAREINGASERTVQRKIEVLEHELELVTFMTRRNPGGNVYRRSLTDDVLKIGRRVRR
jgi:hypothetical protein